MRLGLEFGKHQGTRRVRLIEAMIQGISQTLMPTSILAMVIGIVIALIFGVMPGVGTVVAMVLVLPFTFNLSPVMALVLMVAVSSAGAAGGSVTAILFGIPGTVANAATIIDGFPLTKKGQAGRAVAAALTSSAMGGVFGGLILALLIPVAYSIITSFGSGEMFLVMVFGLTFIMVLAQTGSKLKGVAPGLIGMILGLVGSQPYSGMIRFNFGTTYLYEGLPLIPVLLGMFAFPELINLSLKRGASIADVDRAALKQTQFSLMWEGVKDVFRHWKLFFRTSAIGTIVGIIPAVGQAAAVFIAYGHAKQTSKHPELFGEGVIEGVIAPESANNAVQGGSMLPTLALGLPGSTLMAILLGAFLIHGIAPGPQMLKDHLDLTWTMISVLIIANIMAALFLFPLIGQIAKVAFVRGRLLIPIIMVVIFFGAYASRGEFLDIFMMLIFGVVGYAMMKNGYSRVALLLGLILSGQAEMYFLLAYAAIGPQFLIRPISLVLMGLIFLVLFSSPLKGLFQIIRKRVS